MIPVIVVDLKKNRIRIHKNVLLAIGEPERILLLINPEKRTLAIIPTDRFDPQGRRLSRAAERSNKSFELYSKSLINQLYQVCNHWKPDQLYRLSGQIVSEFNIIVFDMNSAVTLESGAYTQGG